MTGVRRAPALILAVAACAAAACTTPRTEIVLRVTTDMTQGPDGDLTGVQVRVYSEAIETPRFDERFDLGSGGGAVRLPAELGIVPAEADRRRVRVEIDALHDDTVLFTREASAGFVPEETLLLEVFLADRCRDEAARDCGAEETCGASGCEPVEVPSLPIFEPGGGDGDAGNGGMDGGRDRVDAGPNPVDGGPNPVDAGPRPVDGGPNPVDGGPAPVDGGPPPFDAGSCVPSGESCNRADDDCDGRIDEEGCAGDCTQSFFRGTRYLACPVVTSWNAAVAKCEGLGTTLVRIDDADEQAYVEGIRLEVEVWVGGSDTGTEGEWSWLDGTLFHTGGEAGSAVGGLYTHWAANNPRDGAATSCATLTRGGYWIAFDCAADGRTPVCEGPG